MEDIDEREKAEKLAAAKKKVGVHRNFWPTLGLMRGFFSMSN